MAKLGDFIIFGCHYVSCSAVVIHISVL